jgi:hypothetical protein
MSSYIDLKFINDISSRLTLFKKKGDYLFNFRCPHCGDSKKNKTKARGFFYRVKNDMFFKCHNCGAGQSLANFIKFIDPKLYDLYLLERYKRSAPSTPKPTFTNFKPVFEDKTILDDYKKISELDDKHPAKKYLEDRKIPVIHYDKFYLVNKFYELVKKVKKDIVITNDHPRLVIPFYDTTGKLFAFQGRAFGKEQPKYVTIKLDENKRKIYGLERVNLTDDIKIVEGPIDSLFIDNCLAAAGADLFLNNKVSNEKITYIFDNEPRNKEIIKRMYNVIEKGFNIVIWPDDIQLKDVNDMIMNKMSISKVETIISKNTFRELEALTKLSYWKKV